MSFTSCYKSLSQRLAKMFPICKNLKSNPHKFGSRGAHTQKRAHLLTPEHTVNRHTQGRKHIEQTPQP